MSAGTDMFADVADLATALGLVGPSGDISTDFFVDPAQTVAGTLRDTTRRSALLQFLDDVLGDAAPQVTESGATWTPLLEISPTVHLYLVTADVADGVTVGVGVRAATTTSPTALGRLHLALATLPASGPAVFLPGSNSPEAIAQLVAEVDVGSADLQSVTLTATLPTGPGAVGDLAVSVTGLRVPGAATPLDLTLDSAAEIGPQLVATLSALLDSELQAVAGDLSGPATTLLGLFGLSPDSVVPLPLADLATRGVAALRDWLGQLGASDAALSAWFGHLAGLVGATVSGPDPLHATLTLAAGIDLTLDLFVDTDDTGGRRFAPAAGLSAAAGGDVSLELAATLFEASIGAHPTVVALPSVQAHARYGAATGPATILDVTDDGVIVQVGDLRAGVALDAQRRVVFVLAADRVVLGPPGSTALHDVLDLTSPDALADVGGEALASVLGGLISSLGSAGPAVGQLLGLSTPPSWTAGGWPVIDTAAFIANPVAAWFGFQQAVVALGAQAFADLLSALTGLLGLPAVASAAGTGDDPYVLATAGGVALIVWTTTATGTTTLHVGARWQPAAPQLGGADGPTPSLRLLVEALAVTLPGGTAPFGLNALASVSVAAGISTPAGHPWQVAIGAAALSVPSAELALTWTPATGAQAALDLPGATLTVDAATSPFALPSIDGSGDLVFPAGFDDHVLEVVLAGVLTTVSPPWVTDLALALDLGDPAAGGLSFATLLQDPRAWIAARLRSLLSVADPAALDTNLSHIAAVVDGLLGAAASSATSAATPSPAGAGGPTGATRPTGAAGPTGATPVTGTGRPDDPLLVSLQTGPVELDLAVWLDPDGPPIPADVLATLLQPTLLSDWLSGAGAALTTSDLAGLLQAGGARIPALGGLLAGRDSVAAGWDAIVARCAGGDGLLPGGAPDIAAATSSTLAGVAHAALPSHLDLSTLAGLPSGARILYVTGPYVPPWPDPTVPTLDVTTPGLPATAFDTSALAASTAPWHVRLPFRDDCPGPDAASRAMAAAARLGAAIAAAASSGSSVMVVAHGPAAAGTARLAITGAPVVGLVLLGGSAAAIPLDVLDQSPAGDALALARRLLPAPSPGDGPDLGLAQSVVGLLGELLDSAHDPTVDLSPPPGLSAPTVPVWSVRGALDPASLTRSLGGLVQAGLAGFQPGLNGSAPTTLRAGLRVHVPLPASATTNDPAGVSLDLTAHLDLGGLALASGQSSPPGALQLDLEIYRANGWLAGGPQGAAPAPGVLRTPSLRRAGLSVGADLAAVQRQARATLTLFEGSALGVTRDAWVIGTGGDALGPEARVLAGRLAAALTPLPPGGPIAALADLLAAAGLADPTVTAPGFGLSLDALQQLLVDPGIALAQGLSAPAARAAAADALRRLFGFAGTASAVQTAVGPFTIALDLDTSPPPLTVGATDVALPGGAVLTVAATLDTGGGTSGTISLAAPGARAAPGLDVSLGPEPAVALALGATPQGVPSRIPLYPPATSGQLAGIAPAVLAAAGAAAIRALVGALRDDLLTPSQVEALDPVLGALGLLGVPGAPAIAPRAAAMAAGSAVPVLPFGLLTDPIGYLAGAVGWAGGTGPAADRVAALVDDLRELLGLPAASHGVLPVSASVIISAGPGPAGGLEMAIGYTGTEGQLTSTFDAGLTLGPGAAPVPHFDATVGLAGQSTGVAVTLDGAAVAVRLHSPSGDIALLPAGPGLGSLASAATQALPYVLNALHDHAPAPIPEVLDAVRQALGLGDPAFDGGQLRQLAADPGGQLVTRLLAPGGTALAGLTSILPSLPAPWSVTGDAAHLRVGFNDQWVQVTLGGAPQVVTLEASITADLPGIAGASVSFDAVIDTTGVRQVSASGQVSPADPLTIGPLSIAPVVEVAVGPAADPARVEVGVTVADGPSTRQALVSVRLSPFGVTLVTDTNGTPDPAADAGVIVTHFLVPLLADSALHESHVQALLQQPVGTKHLADLLAGVVLTETGSFDTTLLDLTPANLVDRVAVLLSNIAGAVPTISLTDNLALAFSDGANKRGLAITVPAGQRVDLVPGGDIALALEVDASWVSPPMTPAGLSVMVIDASTPPARFIPPVITVDGVGLRLYRRSGPLLDTALSIGSVALFGLARIDAGGPGVTDGGLALQVADLAVAPASAAGGSNGVAQGILGNASKSGGGGDSTALKPAFSPELALQKRQGAPGIAWSLTAGSGNGPWLVQINRSFGPLRVDNVGFGDDVSSGRVTAISIFISGGISLAGLNLDVDELSVTAPWPATPDAPALTDPTAWSLDLAGLDVSYSGGGVELAGGLRRRDNPSLPGDPPDYVGVLLARVGPYGLTAFGGYGQFPSPTGTFTMLFVFAAINAPIGGPPAFFVTGLGGGAGINRALILPTDLDDFATFPMIAALDPNSTLASDPGKAMDLLSSSFPPQQGTFWFAAGVSFTSFALIDVVAVLAIEVGNGFAVSLLGLARAALPTPYFPLAQLELALMAEFSTAEGILEVRAQLTDNSFLLTRDCRLTGGFAYASWFGSNPNAGQFVVSIGGYHPSFNRPDYPAVPRVGFRWDLLGCLTITGGCYFALTSEAIMAGANFTASLVLGPLWASLTLGVDAIVYFDPFHFDASAYATIAAGITIDIDLFFGHITVTLSFHLGAQVEVSGPDIHGSATIDLDVTSATISFGSTSDGSTSTLGWSAFAGKYLTASGTKPVLSAAVGSGAITPAGGAATPDGSTANPWLFVPEFSLSVASTAAADTAGATVNVSTPVPLGGAGGGWISAGFQLTGGLAIAPMGVGAVTSTLGVSIVSGDGEDIGPISFSATPAPPLSLALVTAPLPKGVWAAQLPNGTIPTGDTISAGTGMTLTAAAEISGGSPPIDYGQVQPGARQPLPFGVEETVRPQLDADATNAATFASDASTNSATVLADAEGFLNTGLFATAMTPLGGATFRRDRVAPPRLALLTDGIAPPNVVPPPLTPVVPPAPPPLDTTIHPPVVTAFLSGGTVAQQRPTIRTSVSIPIPAPGSPGTPGGAGPDGPSAGAGAGGTASAGSAPAAGSAESAGSAPAATGSAAAGSAATGSAAGASVTTPRVAAPTVASATAALDPALGAQLLRQPPLARPVLPPSGASGLTAVDGGPATHRAAAPREVHARPVLDPGSSAAVAAHQAALLDGGTTLRPGDLLVTTLPNHEADIDPGAARPTLNVAGDAAVRVVALSALGEVLADQTTNQGDVPVPPHAARLVAWCVGGSPLLSVTGAVVSTAAAGLAGWTATDRLPFVGAGVSLGRDCVVTGLPAPRRYQAGAEAGHQLAAPAAAVAPVIRTILPPSTSVVVVSLDGTAGAEVTDLTLGVDGANRATGADGSISPPVVVTANGRTHLLYDLVPAVPGTVPTSVGVTIGTSPNWSGAGVMGGASTAAATASLLAATGAAGLMAPLLRAPTGSAQVQWSAPPQPSPSGQPPGAGASAEEVH